MADPGKGPAPLLFLDQNEARRAEKFIFWRPPPLSEGLDDRPPPLTEGLNDRPPISQGLDPRLYPMCNAPLGDLTAP